MNEEIPGTYSSVSSGANKKTGMKMEIENILGNKLLEINEAMDEKGSQIDILNSNFISPLSYGIKSSNDTSIIQQALNALSNGGTFILPYGTWNATNITIPDKTGITLLFYGTLKAIAGGNADYLLASSVYVNNQAWSGVPVTLINPKIDGSGIVTNGLVIQSWNTKIETPDIKNCVNGLKITAQTLNGTNFTTSTLVNITVNNPIIRQNTGKGIWICDPARNKITDYFIINGFVYDNTGDGISVDSCAGALIQGVHTYGNARSLFVNIASIAFRVHDCYFEEAVAVRLNDFNSNVIVSLKGNEIKGSVFAYSYNTNVVLKAVGNTFRTANGRYIQQWGNTLILSTSDTFEIANPYHLVGGDGVATNSAAPNKVHAQNCLSTVVGMDKIIQGVQKNNVVNSIII